MTNALRAFCKSLGIVPEEGSEQTCLFDVLIREYAGTERHLLIEVKTEATPPMWRARKTDLLGSRKGKVRVGSGVWQGASECRGLRVGSAKPTAAPCDAAQSTHAGSCQPKSARRGGARTGGIGSRPIATRMSRMGLRSMTRATMRSVPPHGHRSTSI